MERSSLPVRSPLTMRGLPICANSAVFGVSMTGASLGLAFRRTQAGRQDSKSLCYLSGGQKTNRRRAFLSVTMGPIFSVFADHRQPDTGNSGWADYSVLACPGQPRPQLELLNPSRSEERRVGKE